LVSAHCCPVCGHQSYSSEPGLRRRLSSVPWSLVQLWSHLLLQDTHLPHQTA
jgi:hypothetical protein